jgi:L-amino acid N-acyltransferase YncA
LDQTQLDGKLVEQQPGRPVVHARAATPADASALARIYNQGVEGRTSTFETRLRTPEEILAWFDDVHPIVVVEEGGNVIAYAATFLYRPRECYKGVAEFSVYVDRSARQRGAGRLALEALIEASEKAGFWKLVSRIFADNTAVRSLNRAMGVREVGTYEKHGQLDGVWRDVIIVERLIPANITG